MLTSFFHSSSSLAADKGISVTVARTPDLYTYYCSPVKVNVIHNVYRNVRDSQCNR